MLRRTLTLMLATTVSVFALLVTGSPAQAAPVTVSNATQFTDTAGAVVQAHGGGVVKVGSFYYWFGENRNADNTFKAVSAYRSTDLKTWEFRRNVLTRASSPELAVANIERPKVIFNSTTGKFVMWMHKENGSDYNQARAAVAVSDTVDGDYTWRGSFRPPSGTTSRDMTLFKNDDGTAYQITSAAGNADLQIWKLTADYTAYDSLTANPWAGTFREAPALFKRNGVYFMLTSGNSGWKPNQQRYATASSITGPWTAMTDVGDDTGYGSQTTFVLPVQGTSGTSYLYMGDRWGNSMGGTVNDSQYVWLPLTFPTSTTLDLPWYPQVAIDTDAGTVTGVGGGPYDNLVARHSGKCLDVSDNSASDSAIALQYTCGGGLNQQWRLQDAGGGYVRVLAQHSGKCLDVAGASTADGAFVNQYRCGTGTNQQWQFQDQGNGYYRVVARHSGKCLDVKDASTANGARLIQWTCGTGTNQQFQRSTV
ncbi:RICIN domain-containing protein [Streptomyces turgidiscabies]|uniref:Ricin-type beta-trefoil lectin domain protein n=1 Tax=Streptomyces turgidiscabies (strain Car8) TaxID=698760 RepID=L7F617_STRT8|nr:MULTISPECIES: RICIN domain-containing protein [Streptomyces]ELP66559.1 ricin-type beta-trefoil lectin domain protein [Streptomyces turgidiscabies Car8]MDX3494833.1 RICIN domain-containing protein [Streptomyces turgidiscabies]GAQ71442.1 extracellular exo-alpha-L-arabinofuranosidase precursor [Streptomyces turgidiscabies]